MNNTIKTVAEVKELKVAEMRKVAVQFGIKNASKYKRVELEQMLIDAVTALAVKAAKEEKKAKAKTKKASKSNTTVKTTKALKVADDQVEALANAIVKAGKVDRTELMGQNRKVLIRVMKALHCKMWYRTYDKPTMVAKILESVQ